MEKFNQKDLWNIKNALELRIGALKTSINKYGYSDETYSLLNTNTEILQKVKDISEAIKLDESEEAK